MRTVTSGMKRCLALLLAVLLLVPAMSMPVFASEDSHIHNHAENHQILSQLIGSHYDDIIVNEDCQITAVEKVILNSGALLGDKEFEIGTELGTGNVTLNAVDKSITAAVVEDAENNSVWTPVSAGVYVDEVEKERIALTQSGSVYVGNYTFDGSAFYVVVNYQLVKTLTADEKQAIVDLLNTAYYLSVDLDVINLLVSDASVELMGNNRTVLSVLSALTDTTIGAAMGLGDGKTIIDLLYDISQGTMSQVVELPFESEAAGGTELIIPIEMRSGNNGKPARTAAETLKAQQDANGGKLDLSKFFADHGLISYLEIVGKHGDELDNLLAALYANLGNVNGSRGLGYAVDELQLVIEDTIPGIKEEAVEWINEQLTALQTAYPTAGIELISSLDDLAKVVENLKAERTGMLNLINKTLAQLNAMLPTAGLPASVSTVAELENLKTQLQPYAGNAMVASFVASLDQAIAGLPVFDEAIANMEMGMNISELDALQDTLDALVLLNEVLDATYEAMEPVVDNAGLWQTGALISSESSAVYTSIMNAVTEAVKTGALRVYELADIGNTLVIAEDADQANMSMSDVTITIALNVVDAANSYYTHSLKKVITVANGTTAAELESAVNAFAAEAVEKWTEAGNYVDGKYECVDVDLPDEVTGATTVVVTYNPAKFTVNMLGEASEKDYGWTITLPVHADSTKAYDYLVNGTHYMQGSALVVKNDLTITREEGDGYTAEKLFPMVSARFDEYLKVISSTANAADGIDRVKAIINSGALGIENANIYVRYPKNCVAIAGVENSNDYIVTAQPYAAVYNGADWIPVSVTVFEGVNGETSRTVTASTKVDGAYEFTFASNSMHHVVVNYQLSLADVGLTEEYVKTTMNEIMEVYNDVVDQLGDMQYLVNALEYLQKLNSTVLDTAKGLTDNPDTIAAIEQMEKNNLDGAGNMILVSYLENYVSGTPKGLEYYYENFEIIDAEVQSLKGPMEILGKDKALLDELDTFQEGIGDKVGSVTETIVAIDLTGPDENLNNVGLKNLLNAIGASTNSNATFTALPYLEAGDALPGGEMILESSLSLAGPGMAKVVVNVTVIDIFKNRTTQSTVPVTVTIGDKLTADQIDALVAAVQAINPNERNHDPMDDPETVEVEPLYSEAGLRELLGAEVEGDLVISYYWERYHDCEWTIATCTQASYCIYCKAVNGEPDTVNGHTWDAGVVSLAPTCEKTGLTLFTCAECSGTKTEEIPALGHAFGEYVSDGNVTCSTLGTKTAYCTREGCNVYDRVTDEETPLLPHDLSGWSKVEGGIYHTRGCYDCDYTETAAHTWDPDGVVYAEKAPTCTTDGWRTFTCTACGETKDEVEPATGHDYDESAWVSNASGHAHPCKNGCGATSTYEPHVFPDTPCDEKSTCEICGYIKPAGEHKWGAWEKVDDDTHQRTCPTCDDVEIAEHKWNDGVVTTAPTCTEKGVKTYTCNDCGATYTEEVAATGHSYVPVVTAPTCTEKGYTTFTCSACDDSYVDDYVAATGHSYGNWTVTTKPTCTEKGEQRRLCAKCGTYEYEEIPATGHDYKAVVTAPTCTKQGYTTYTCSVCGDSYVSDYTDMVEHDWDNGVVTVDPTCTENGEKTYTCFVCGETYTEVVSSTGHDYDADVTDPTCTEQGYTTYTCDCGHSYVGDYVDATGHDFGDWYRTQDPTCTVKGEDRRDCKNGCGEYETREVPMVDHNFTSGIYQKTDAGHAEKCTECDTYGPVKAHSWNTNDCEATDAECTICHYTRTVGAHSWSDWTKVDNDKHERSCSVCHEHEEAAHTPKNEGVVTTEPTCSVPGVRTHTCFDCDGEYTEVIPATGIHVFDKTQDPIVVTDPTCEVPGEGYYPCTYGCGEKETVELPAIGHDWDDGVETTAPGCESAGVKTYTCQNDPTHTYTEEIPALGHDYQLTGAYDDEGHEVECSRCNDIITVDHEWVKVGGIKNGMQDFECECGAQKTEKVKPEEPADGYLDDFNPTWDRTNEILKIDVPDTNGNYTYAYEYTIYMGTYPSTSTYSLRAAGGTPIILTVTVNNGNEVYTLNLNNLLVEQYPQFFAGAANADALADFVYNAWQNPSSVVITCDLIDLSENDLVRFVNGLNAGGSNALKFSLVQNADESYTIVANVGDAESIQGAVMNVAMALVFNGIYNKIGMKSWAVGGDYETVFNNKISIQALINGFLYEDGFGTGTIVNAFTETGAINPAAIQDYYSYLVGSDSTVGALIQTAYMSLGTDTETKYEVEFHLTMSQGSGMLVDVRNLLEEVEPILSAETRKGKMQLTLKEKIYEIYQAEMMFTGVADKDDLAIATNKDACAYLYEYLKVLMGKKVNVSTYENTLEKLGQGRDLSKYETILNLMIDEFGKAQLTPDCLSVNMSRNGKTTIDKLISKLNVAVNPDLLGAIKEYGDPTLDLSVELTAAFEPAEVKFDAVIIDVDNDEKLGGISYSEYINKFNFVKAGEIAGAVGAIQGYGAVMLLDDFTGNLVFNGEVILDLNGKTINGNIVSNGKLIIVDSCMDTNASGVVTGSVTAGASGTVYITGGKYGADVSKFLKNGYVQDSNGVVVNELYTISETAAGEYVIALHSAFSTKPSEDMGLALAIDLLTDMMLNGFDFASMTIAGDADYEIYNITLTDLIALYAGGNLTDTAINAVMEDVDFEAIRLFANDLLAGLLDFETIAGTYEDADTTNDGVVATYSITAHNWDIVPEYVSGEDYIEFNVVSNTATSDSMSLTVLVDGEMAETLFAELGEVAEATATISKLEVVYNNKVVNVDVAGDANVALNLTNSVDKHDSYIAVIAVVLAKAGNTDLLNVLNAGGDRNAQWDAFNGVSVKDVVTALKSINTNTNFATLATQVGLTTADATELETLNTAYQALGYTAGALLSYLDITGSSTQKMGALDPDGDGCYVFDDFASNAYTYSKAYTAQGFTVEMAGAMTAALTLKVFDDPNTYTIVWKNDDGSVIRTDTNVAYKAATPAAPVVTKAATAQYTYTFAGWTPAVAAEVTADAVYTATYIATVNTYTVTWQDEDGTVLETDTVPYGDTPVYTGATPTKAADAQYTYSFAGWAPAVSAVTGDVTYTATYKAEAVSYTVTLGGTGKFNITANGNTYNQNSASKTFTVNAGSTLKFKASAASGYNFIRLEVLVDGVAVTGQTWAQNVEYTITVTGNVTIKVYTETQPYIPPYIPVTKPTCECGDRACKCKTVDHVLAYEDLKEILDQSPNIWWNEDGHRYLEYVICKGLMIGVSDTNFAPNMNMSRAMIVTVLYRNEGEPTVTGKPSDYYTDALDGVWYSDALVWATQEGIILGYGNNRVGPNDVLTREQLATLFYRYTAHKGKNVDIDTDATDSYFDANQISDWAADGMEWACSVGLIVGPGNNTLVPKGDIRRCDFAALLCRWIWGEYDK